MYAPKPVPLARGSKVFEVARSRLAYAAEIMDNPGGGLLFASQAIGQARAALEPAGVRPAVLGWLREAEARVLRRNFEAAREQLAAVFAALPVALGGAAASADRAVAGEPTAEPT